MNTLNINWKSNKAKRMGKSTMLYQYFITILVQRIKKINKITLFSHQTKKSGKFSATNTVNDELISSANNREQTKQSLHHKTLEILGNTQHQVNY